MIGMNAHKLDVRLLGIGLGDKTSQKADNRAALCDGKTRFAKVNKKYPWQQAGYVPAAPPIINDRNNRLVVVFLQMPDVHNCLSRAYFGDVIQLCDGCRR